MLAPFATVSMLVEGYQKIQDGYDVAFPIYAETGRAERQMVMIEGRLISRHPEYDNVNSNYWPQTYQHASQFFWFKTIPVIREQTFMLGNKAGVIVPQYAVQDFDTEDDWKAAEIKYKILHKPENNHG